MNAMIIFFIRMFPFSPLLFLFFVLILRSVSPLTGVMHLETLRKSPCTQLIQSSNGSHESYFPLNDR